MLRIFIAGGVTLGLIGGALAETGWGASSSAPAKPVAAPAKPLAAPAKAAGGATVKDIDALQKAVTDAWEKAPLTQRRRLVS